MKRGEIWQINLDPTVGAEIKKKRPCVIVNNDAIGKLPLLVIVPITKWDERYSNAAWHIPIINSSTIGLTKKSSADTLQVRFLSKERFIDKLGVLTKDDMERVGEGLKIVLLLDR